MSLGDNVKNAELPASDPPIQPTLDLYRVAPQKGYQVFFITGHSDMPENRRITEENLRKAGYDNWKALYLKPATYNQLSVVPYKSGVSSHLAARWRGQAGCPSHQELTFCGVGFQPAQLTGARYEVRKKITEAGSRIVLNVGDQYSDLEGGYAERTLKLPNPFYFIP